MTNKTPTPREMTHARCVDVAWVLGVTRQTVANWVRRHNCPRNQDSAKSYSLADVVAWRLRLERQGQDDDPLMAGSVGVGGSPALERYRAAKAAREELHLAEQRKNLIKRDEVVAVLNNMAQVIRNVGADLQRKHGPEAQQAIDEAIDDFAKHIGVIDV